jgi:predicted transcriptional regulator
MSNTVLSIRVTDEMKEQLELLATTSKRSKAYLAKEAIADYINRNAWKAKALRDAVTKADEGVFISQDAMEDWVNSLGTENELPPPAPDIFPNKTT